MLKSFNSDFNWTYARPAKPYEYSDVDIDKLLDYYIDLGANNIWTFCVTYNGYAWFPSKTAPMIEGLNYNFTKLSTEKAHLRGLEVFSYFCIGGNPYLQEKKPEWTRQEKEGEAINMIFTDEYLDYFCTLLKEGIYSADFDGIVIDWFRKPFKVRDVWVKAEIALYESLMNEKFPQGGIPTDMQIEEYEKLVIEKAWRRVKATVDSCDRIVKIWTNQPFDKINDPIWEGNILLQEVDYVLNEGPDFEMLKWIKSQCGSHTTVVQNLCGWPDHSMEDFNSIDLNEYGLFGFAAADPKTCLPYENVDDIETLLKKPDLSVRDKECLEYAKKIAIANNKNIEIIKKIYRNGY